MLLDRKLRVDIVANRILSCKPANLFSPRFKTCKPANLQTCKPANLQTYMHPCFAVRGWGGVGWTPFAAAFTMYADQSESESFACCSDGSSTSKMLSPSTTFE